jgi:glyoxylase-like metal-dependent hydrolase (beta-lactamase superfamily II)
MNANVDPATRREALKKLFAGDAHFNLPDPFEAYSEDYTGGEPIPPEMLKTLNQAKKLLFDEPEKVADAATPQESAPPPADAKDVPGSKDA